MIKIYKYGEVSNDEIFARENIDGGVEGIVSGIIENVVKNKDRRTSLKIRIERSPSTARDLIRSSSTRLR